MHQFIINLFFFQAAQAFGKDVETTKIQLVEIGKKFDLGVDCSLANYSLKMREIIYFYLENKKYL